MSLKTATANAPAGDRSIGVHAEPLSVQPGELAEKRGATAELVATIAPYSVAALLLIALAWPVLKWWWWEYTRPESYYSHGPLIPLMAGFMLWSQRDRLAETPKQPNLYALLILIPALALLLFAIKEDARSLQSMGLMLAVWSSVWLALGTGFVKRSWFSLLFLTLMMPLPGPLLNDATLSLQMVSTVLAAKLLNLLSFTNVQQGNLISMSNFTLFVDVPCSGFKTLLALFTFNAFLAAMLDGSVGRRVALFLLCAPLALAINAVRIALIGMVGECISSDAAHTFHDYSGLITIVLGFILLFFVARLFGCKKFAGLAIF